MRGYKWKPSFGTTQEFPYAGSGDYVVDWKKSSLPYKLGKLGFIY